MAADPLDQWDFSLPDDRIARYPARARDQSRLLVVHPDRIEHKTFRDLPRLLNPGDAIVLNDTKVMAARLPGQRISGAKLELLVLQPGPGPVECMIRNARRLQPGEEILVAGTRATVLERLPDGLFLVDLPNLHDLMASAGVLPLPPYLGRENEPMDAERYQTVFAGPLGAAAAPTAGLHFSSGLLDELRNAGIGVHTITLHVGIGTFRPLRTEDIERGELHPEPWTVPASTALALADVRRQGGRIVAVGTTSARTLEAATAPGASVPDAGSGVTRLFLQPGRSLTTVDGLITNFHLPRSSLLMLVAALIGRERLLHVYDTAIHEGYRFYSYGDAMLIL